MTDASTSAAQIRLPAGISHQRFLREFWQQQPLLMPRALSPVRFPLDADELAGLACEAEIESRLVIDQGADRWLVRHGPFDEEDFAALPESHWTLLVQDVDKFVPAVAALIEHFSFVPDWRIDDIMISFATDQGGVGPHIDAYDVFLMQASGRRRWRLSFGKYTDDDLISGLQHRVLARFDTDQEWVLEPGDILYLPPGLAHWGIAEGECVTYSLGFRAPSQRDLAADWFQHLVSLSGEQRLPDPRPGFSNALTEISPELLAEARCLLRDLPTTDSVEFKHWFGCYITEPKPQFQILPLEHEWTYGDLNDWVRQGGQLVRHPAARMVWMRTDESTLMLYYRGEGLALSVKLQETVIALCAARRFDAMSLLDLLARRSDASDLMLRLLNDGVLEPKGAT